MAAIVLVVVAAGCGSGTAPVELAGGTQATAGKAVSFTASTTKKLGSQKGGVYAVELRGIDKRDEHASFDRPEYVNKQRCIARPCAWIVLPGKASSYEFQAFLIDLRSNKPAGHSRSVKIDWAAPPRPHALRLFVNGKLPPTTPLDGEDYSDFPKGPMRLQARWATDARGTGYYLKISIGDHVYARCTTGTSCRVRDTVQLPADTEISWVVQLLTTHGNQIVDGFKVCLTGSTT